MIADLSDSQLQGLAGGPTLQSVCMNLSASVSRKPCRRLKDALVTGIDGHSLLLPLYILICQQVDHSLFYDADSFNPAPLKVHPPANRELLRVRSAYSACVSSGFGRKIRLDDGDAVTLPGFCGYVRPLRAAGCNTAPI